MRYRQLGRTGLDVSEIGHGLWGMGDWSGSSPDESLAALTASLEAGVNFYDSAAAYGDGRSDELLGTLVAAHPGTPIVTAGKIPPKNLRWPASSSDSFEDVFPLQHVLEHAGRTRERMGVPTLDLMQLHVWDDSWASDPAFAQAASELKARGLARFFGISLNRWEPWNGIAAIRTGFVDTVQVIYNIFDQAPEDELFPECERLNIGVIARVPLDEGSLGGRMTLDTRFPADDWRSLYFGPENLSPTIERVDALKRIVPEGMTLPEMALRFVLQNRAVSTLVAGMRSRSHVSANAAASGAPPLGASLMEELRRHRWDRVPSSWSD